MNRRAFAGLSAAALAGCFGAHRLTRWYRAPSGLLLWGDGVHDDTVALQSFLDGKPVRWRGTVLRSAEGPITGGAFLLTDTLRIRADHPPVPLIHNSVLTWNP